MRANRANDQQSMLNEMGTLIVPIPAEIASVENSADCSADCVSVSSPIAEGIGSGSGSATTVLLKYTVQIAKLTNAKMDDEIKNLDAAVVNKRFAELMDQFKVLNPAHYQLFTNKTQRAALQRLIDRLGYDRVWNVVQIAGQTNGQPFAPSITTPLELERKLGHLASFVKRQQGIKSKVSL